MRLASFRLEHFRRFQRPSTIDLGAPVVAVVGPNEAGKSSLLEAMSLLDERSSFTRSQFSGRRPPPGNPEVLSGLFVLDDEDRHALADLPEASAVRFYRAWKTADGVLGAEVLPTPRRNRRLRQEVLRDVERVLTARARRLRALLDQPSDPDEDDEEVAPREELRRRLSRISEGLAADTDTLPDGIRRDLTWAASELGAGEFSTPAYLERLPKAMQTLADQHQQEHPSGETLRRLIKREPSLLLMGEGARELKTDYDLEEVETPPEPLSNLLALTDVTYATLREAAREPGDPRLTTLLREANSRLLERLRGSWRQSNLSIEIDVHANTLQVFPIDLDTGTHTRVEERSDGFRAFLAMLTFATRHQASANVVLLIDEAERHLHYRAQADLVSVFTSQRIAAQVVYTTHSAGCLPEDLGSSVRVVEPAGALSTIRNGFWSGDRPGFTPLLLAMGASALAFTPTRRAVIAEGPSDALLLPALLRDARGLDPRVSLGFQVAPGIAWVSEDELRKLDIEAARVAYVVDSDEGGKRLKQRLLDNGVPNGRILEMSARTDGLSIEDFVHGERYLRAVNYLLAHARDSDHKIGKSEVPRVGRARYLDQWCEERGIRPLSRPALAEAIRNPVSGGMLAARTVEEPTLPFVDPRRVPALRRLHAGLAAALDLELEPL